MPDQGKVLSYAKCMACQTFVSSDMRLKLYGEMLDSGVSGVELHTVLRADFSSDFRTQVFHHRVAAASRDVQVIPVIDQITAHLCREESHRNSVVAAERAKRLEVMQVIGSVDLEVQIGEGDPGGGLPTWSRTSRSASSISSPACRRTRPARSICRTI